MRTRKSSGERRRKQSVAVGGARSEPRSESVVPAAKRSDGVVVGRGADEGKVVEELRAV